MSGFTESVIEQAALAWLEALGYAASHGPAISAGEPGAERSDPNYRDVVLEPRLRQALVITLERDPLAPCYEPYLIAPSLRLDLFGQRVIEEGRIVGYTGCSQ